MNVRLWFCLFLIQFDLYTCFLEPFSTYIAGTTAVAAFYWGYKKRCDYIECCDVVDVENFRHRLKQTLDRKLFAQHLLNQVLPIAIHSHVNKVKPAAPLIISLHGWTGSGKTYTAQIVAETMFKKGLKSIFVKKLTPAVLFPNQNQVNEYKVGQSGPFLSGRPIL